MSDDVALRKDWDIHKTWYKLRDPRSVDARRKSKSMTLQDRWFYGPDARLDIRFEDTPERGFSIWFNEDRIGFITEIAPEPVLGDSIRAAKKRAVKLLASTKGGNGRRQARETLAAGPRSTIPRLG